MLELLPLDFGIILAGFWFFSHWILGFFPTRLPAGWIPPPRRKIPHFQEGLEQGIV